MIKHTGFYEFTFEITFSKNNFSRSWLLSLSRVRPEEKSTMYFFSLKDGLSDGYAFSPDSNFFHNGFRTQKSLTLPNFYTISDRGVMVCSASLVPLFLLVRADAILAPCESITLRISVSIDMHRESDNAIRQQYN